MPSHMRRFTLIELLTTISIIAILMAMLAPSLFVALKRARAVTCAANMSQWGSAITSYSNDYNDYYPGYTIWELNDRITGVWSNTSTCVNPNAGAANGYCQDNKGAQLANVAALMTYTTAEMPICALRSEPRNPSYKAWPFGVGGWNVLDYFVSFGQGNIFGGRPNTSGWYTPYWTTAYGQNMGPVVRPLDARKETTPIMWDRTWIAQTIAMDVAGCAASETCGYYSYDSSHNQISNHNKGGGRDADNQNILLLDGSVQNSVYNTGDASWMYYGRDYYNRFWFSQDILNM